jgi:hypothetical protein
MSYKDPYEFTHYEVLARAEPTIAHRHRWTARLLSKLLLSMLALLPLASVAHAQYYQGQPNNPCTPMYGGNQGLLGMALGAIQQQQRAQDCQRHQQYLQQKALIDQQERAKQQALENQRAGEAQAAREVAERNAEAARAIAEHKAAAQRDDAKRKAQIHATQVAAVLDAAEKSSDNVCKSPEVAEDMMNEATKMQKRDYGNLFRNLYGREFPDVLDIEHLVTVKNDEVNKDLVCHGIWVYSSGARIAGFFEAKPNVANRIILWWRPGDWSPDASIVTIPAPPSLNSPRATMEANATPTKPGWYHHQ